MNIKRFSALILYFIATVGNTAPTRAELSVWANEAVISTYTFNYKTYLQDQKNSAKYFTAQGWLAYIQALNASKLPEAVQKNNYDVTAVATQPPKLVFLDPTHWQATMTILVVYQNSQYSQRQNLKIVLGFSEVPAGQGVRGMSITSLQSTLISPPCQCPNPKETSTSTPAIPAVEKK
jgi:hypothetical protein